MTEMQRTSFSNKNSVPETIDEDTDSEESYAPLFTKRDFEIFITYLTHDLRWMFIASCASGYFYVHILYERLYAISDILLRNTNAVWEVIVIVVTSLSVAIMILDTVSAVIHTYWTKYLALKDTQPRLKVLLTLDVITSPILLVSFFNYFHLKSVLPAKDDVFGVKNELYRLYDELQVPGHYPPQKELVNRLAPEYLRIYMETNKVCGKYRTINLIVVVVATYSMHRIIRYFYVISKTSGTNKIYAAIQIYGFSVILIHHSFVCIWGALTCEDTVFCGTGENWSINIQYFFYIKQRRSLTAAGWYALSSYFISQGLSGDAFGDITPVNVPERIMTIVVMIIGFIILSGAFIGGCTSLCLENYRSHASFLNRLKLIKELLVYRNCPRMVANKIMTFYHTFWTQRSAIRIPSLIYRLPPSIQKQIPLDKYWNAINRTHILKNSQYAFKKAVASVMTTEIYTAGEVVYQQGKLKHAMVYIFKGSLQLLSEEDGESPILTLGMGTVLGETSLFYNYECTNTVVASSYCILHCLPVAKLWNVAFYYHKLGETKRIHDLTDSKIAIAKEKVANKAESDQREKVLKVMKTQLKRETSRIVVRSAMEALQQQKASDMVTSDLYIISLHEASVKKNDEVYIQTKWPWIFQPSSKFIEVWDGFIFILLIIIAIFYPYEIAIERGFSYQLEMLITLIDFAFVTDVILTLFTGIETEQGTVTNVLDIFLMRCRSITFGIAVIAAIPFDHISLLVLDKRRSRILALLSVNRILKLNKAYFIIKRLEDSLKFNVAVVRYIKYITYIFFLSYFFGSVLYILACFYETCSDDAWFMVKKRKEVEYGGTLTNQPFVASLYFAMAAVTQIGYAIVSPYNFYEIVFVTAIFYTGTLAFCYLIADYSATLMLAYTSKSIYAEIVNVIRNYLQANEIVSTIQKRWNNYLNLQWQYNKGYNIIANRRILYDLPHYLQSENIAALFTQHLMEVPIFKNFPKDCVNSIAASCEMIVLPKNEIVLYAGDICHALFIIERGFCETMSSASGTVEKLMGPKSHFGAFEMFLGKPGLFSIRTVTDVFIIKVSQQNIVKALNPYANLKKAIYDAVAVVKDSFVVHKHFHEIKNVSTYQYFNEEKSRSFFHFPKHKLHPLNIDYVRGFEKRGPFGVLRHILLRNAIMPNGKFAFGLAIFRAICAFFAGMLFPSYLVIGSYYESAPYFLLMFNFLAFIDIYLRFSMCYYDSRGLLISHPLKTAKHYLSGTFAVDFIGAFPFSFFLRYLLKYNQNDPATYSRYLMHLNIASFTEVLQIHRIPDALKYFEKDEFSEEKTIIIILKNLPILIVLFNCLTNILLLLTCTFVQRGRTFYFEMTSGWFLASAGRFATNIHSTMHIYCTGCYWIMQMTTTVSFADIFGVHYKEVIFILIVILIGYFCMNYLLVTIMSGKGNVNLYLTVFRENLIHLIQFMKKHKISHELETKTIQHFQNNWYRTHGIRSRNILRRCHQTLLEDTVLHLYSKTFNDVPAFTDVGRSFYRLLGRHVHESYFLTDYTILTLNDVVSTMYIVHRGEVVIYGPDKTVFAVLKRGCVFGNIDNVLQSRSSVYAVCKTDVDVLWIDTSEFYKLAENYPLLKSKISKYLLSENSTYICSSWQPTDLSVRSNREIETMKLSYKWMQYRYFTSFFNGFVFLVSFLSCLIVPYHLGFQDHRIVVFILTYLTDLFFAVIIAFFFLLAYRNERGHLITNRKLIRKRYMIPSRFYVDLFSVLPLEVFSLWFRKDKLYYLTWFRINRIFRIVTLYRFISFKFDHLNINVLLSKLFKVVVYFIISVHIGTCVLYLIACPAGRYNESSWFFSENKDGERVCSYPYLCSLYFMICIITGTGFGDIHARNSLDMIVVIILMLLGRVHLGMFVADFSAIIQYYLYNLKNYDYKLMKFRRYLTNSYISQPLLENISRYATNLFDRERGQQNPIFLLKSPLTLRTALKNEAYDEHLYRNYIFSSCHNDFIRLVVSKMNALTFFAGNIICEEGEVNDTMFFIHRGEVEQYFIKNYEEVHSDVLRKNDCFGIVQGLFSFTPHTHTYRAIAVSTILTLNLKDWAYLLKFYPAARYAIYDKIYHM